MGQSTSRNRGRIRSRGVSLLIVLLLFIVSSVSCAERGNRIPVLLYHQISDEPSAQTIVTPERFERDIRFLKNQGYQPVSLTDLEQFLAAEKELPAKPVLITFDDGWASQYKLAGPILEKYGYTAALFPFAGLIGEPGYLTWAQLKEMLNSKTFELGSKSYALYEKTESVTETGGVTFNFDDGWQTVFTEAFPVLEEKGIKATLFPIVTVLKKPIQGYMTLDEVKQLSEAGWEVGSHGLSHRDLTALNQNDLKKELVESQQYLRDHGFVARSLAFPEGLYNATVLGESLNHYEFVRSAEKGFNSFPLTFPLKSQVVTNRTTYEDVAGWVDEAKRDKKWLLIQFHQIDGSGSDYAATPDLFVRVVDYVYASGLPTPIMAEVEGRYLVLPQRRNGKLESAAAYRQRLIKDFKKSRDVLKTKAGVEPNYAAYPYGAWNANTIEALKQTGFKGAFTGAEGAIKRNQDPFLLKRILVDENTDLQSALAKAR